LHSNLLVDGQNLHVAWHKFRAMSSGNVKSRVILIRIADCPVCLQSRTLKSNCALLRRTNVAITSFYGLVKPTEVQCVERNHVRRR